ncbi:hypothetical protein [Streptomyces yaizuensis]|uniref:Membrane protein n=1 Tax=Streptomyces yaizuensis TaxID=2989713 RepID=A0ABQ5NWT8_9ACTN|nr:hypothetical protein [Streptomyces sp. YSPA8]GLF94816.1 membrane protein [Streptomyces sp. YSPA8]
MDLTKTDKTSDAPTGTDTPDVLENDTENDAENDAADRDDDADLADEAEATSSAAGLLSAAGAVVAAALGMVGLSGSWIGRIAAERQTLIGQLETSQGGTPAAQISAIYGDAWHTTALVNGVFALIALIIAIAVLTRPERPAWVRAWAIAGAVLGAIGAFLAVGMYFDLFLALPKAGS